MTKDLSIESLCGGAVQERINRALRKVSDNILDPNTEAKKKRVINLQLTFVPSEDDREDVTVEAAVTMKLAPEEKVHTQLYINRDLTNNHVTITEHVKGMIKGQMSFDDFGLVAIPDDEPAAEDLGCDPETGEIIETEEPQASVVDFRTIKRAQEG